MPVNNTPISINPIDLNKNVAVGVVFPLMAGGIFQQSFTFKEQVKSNIINVLLTQKGERVNLPDFGAGLKTVLFENNVDQDMIRDMIIYQLQLHVPEIDLQDVEVNADLARHVIQIKLIYGFFIVNYVDSIEININQSSPGMNG